MDHYPFFEYPAGSNLTSSVAGYRANLGVLRAAALRANIPFWNVRASDLQVKYYS